MSKAKTILLAVAVVCFFIILLLVIYFATLEVPGDVFSKCTFNSSIISCADYRITTKDALFMIDNEFGKNLIITSFYIEGAEGTAGRHKNAFCRSFEEVILPERERGKIILECDPPFKQRNYKIKANLSMTYTSTGDNTSKVITGSIWDTVGFAAEE